MLIGHVQRGVEYVALCFLVIGNLEVADNCNLSDWLQVAIGVNFHSHETILVRKLVSGTCLPEIRNKDI